MVKSAVADIVCPAVTAEYPLALLNELIFVLKNIVNNVLNFAFTVKVFKRFNKLSRSLFCSSM